MQIDIMFYPIGDSYKNILLLVDIMSRKAWAYVLPSMSWDNILNKYKEFLSEVGNINGIEGDNQFSFKSFVDFNESKNIRLDTSISKDEHITAHGNKLGIIDRPVCTLKDMIDNIEWWSVNKDHFKKLLIKLLKHIMGNIIQP